MARRFVNAFQLSVDVVTFWYDSMNVLWWIRGRSGKLKPFIANRVFEIQSITNPIMRKYVSKKIKPAYLVCRGTAVNVLTSNDL